MRFPAWLIALLAVPIAVACGDDDDTGDDADAGPDAADEELFDSLESITDAPIELHDIWVSEEGPFFCGSRGEGAGQVARYDGESWEVMDAVDALDGVDGRTTVWGAATADVFAATEHGAVARFDGSAWAQVREPRTLSDVWVADDGTAFAVGARAVLRLEGDEWTEVYTAEDHSLLSVHGSSASDVYVGGTGGLLLHYDGSSWTEIDSVPEGGNVDAVWSVSADLLFVAIAGAGIYGFDGSSWEIGLELFPSNNGTNEVTAFHGSSPSDVYAVGYEYSYSWDNGHEWRAYAYHFDGMEWTEVEVEGYPDVVSDVWVADSGEVFVVADGVLNELVGQALVEVDVGLPWSLNQVWGSALDDLYVAGGAGLVRRFDGSAWSDAASPTRDDIVALHGFPGGGLVAAGRGGSLSRYDGGEWTADVAADCSGIVELTGNGADDVWALCSNSHAVLHFDGGGWSDVALDCLDGQQVWLAAIAAGGPGDVAAVGYIYDPYEASGEEFTDRGVVVNLDGDSCTWEVPEFVQHDQSYLPLTDVWSDGSGSYVAVGRTAIGEFDGSAWTPFSGAPLEHSVHAIWGKSMTNLFGLGKGPEWGAAMTQHAGGAWHLIDYIHPDWGIDFSLGYDIDGSAVGDVYAVIEQDNWVVRAYSSE